MKGSHYELRAHSLRKFFKTQLLSLGVQPDYVDYMMGHSVDVYHDIQMKGVEFLRNVYSASGLSIRPKTKASKLDVLKEVIRAHGFNPEQILTRDALTDGATTYVNSDERESRDLHILGATLRDLIREEIRKG